MSCVFCDIVAGKAVAFRVLENDACVAFLDMRPVFAGHTLLVPREHHETLVDLPPTQIAPLFAQAQRLARVMETALGAQGTFVAMNNRVSQSVPHLHVHVVPRQKKDGLKGFFWPRRPYASDAEAQSFADRIRAGLAA